MNQITTCTFFKLEGLRNKLWAFTQMQFGHKSIKGADGLVFYKLLGSGAKNGFSVIPNFGTYVLLCVWKSEEAANQFLTTKNYLKKYQSKSTEYFTVYAQAAEVHGKWDGMQPFEQSAQLVADKPVMVLTRATIRFSKLLSFWSKVGKVSKSLENYTGLVLSIGVGEWPLIQQATLSVWKTKAEMMDYAYKNQHHKEVVQLTRKLNWYNEEMFARFVPYKFHGKWNGKMMEQLLNTL
jgi:hypothetical protein